MDDISRQRLKHNEAVFRAVNEEIDDLGTSGGGNSYVCECADDACTATIRLPHAEYTRIRSQRNHFIVKPGHEVPTIERVVERAPDHLVVDKGRRGRGLSVAPEDRALDDVEGGEHGVERERDPRGDE
jgi:hypothetical protein